jgi:hypothetical protein
MIELMMHVPATHGHRPRPDDAPLAWVADVAVATVWAAFEAIIDWYTCTPRDELADMIIDTFGDPSPARAFTDAGVAKEAAR